MKNGNRWDTSNVLFDKGRLLAYDKRARSPDMAHIDYGLGVLSASVLTRRSGTFDLADVYQELARLGQLAGLEVHQRFYEIGSHDGLRDTCNYFLSREPA
jgi:hypothetical protein